MRRDFVNFFSKHFQVRFFAELTGIILKGTCHMKLDKIGKFLSAILERADVLLRETE